MYAPMSEPYCSRSSAATRLARSGDSHRASRYVTWSAGSSGPIRCRAVCSEQNTHGAAMLLSPRTVPTTFTSLPLIFGLPSGPSRPSRCTSDSSTMTLSGMVSASSCSRVRTTAAPAEPASVLLPSRKQISVPPTGLVKLAKLPMYSSTLVTPGTPATRVRYEVGIGLPRSTADTAVDPIHRSAVVLSIGMEVILNSPRSSPHCSAISTAENVTASTPDAYRERSCQRVWRA